VGRSASEEKHTPKWGGIVKRRTKVELFCLWAIILAALFLASVDDVHPAERCSSQHLALDDVQELRLLGRWLDPLSLDAWDKGDEKACPNDCAPDCEGIGYAPWKGSPLVTWKCKCITARACGRIEFEPPRVAGDPEGFQCACVYDDRECPTYALDSVARRPNGSIYYKVIPYSQTPEGGDDERCK
jgi:hypothetical protein